MCSIYYIIILVFHSTVGLPIEPSIFRTGLVLVVDDAEVLYHEPRVGQEVHLGDHSRNQRHHDCHHGQVRKPRHIPCRVLLA